MSSHTLRLPLSVAVGFHLALGIGFYLYKINLESDEIPFVVDAVVPDERLQEEFVKDLDEQEKPAEVINFVAGGVVSDQISASESPIANMQPVELIETNREPDFFVVESIHTLVGPSEIATDFGEAAIKGEPGALVQGYGDALDRITQELIRMMRQDKLLVVWLLDETEGMQPDLDEIKARIHRVYDELQLVTTEPVAAVQPQRGGRLAARSDGEPILTAMTAFGQTWRPLTTKPTSDVALLRQDIDKIKIDLSGKENTYQAIAAAMGQYSGLAKQQKRKLVMIVVSDESGDDGDGAGYELVLHQAKNVVKAPIYFIGREAAFGSYFAHVQWRHPYSGNIHYLPIRRGPETPFPELLQHNGFGKRLDSQMSGFGPYTMTRMARDTGGIYFMIPGETRDLHDFEAYKYDMLDLREYLPDLGSRQDYEREVNKRPFRRAIWDAIHLLNPYKPDKDGRPVENSDVSVPTGGWYDVADSARAGGNADVRADLQKIMQVLERMNRAQKRLEDVRHLRAEEESLRWRANYDLMYAQFFAYRVRLFEYGIALGQFQNHLPELLVDANKRETGRSDLTYQTEVTGNLINARKVRNESNNPVNRWRVMHGQEKMIMPDEEQQAFFQLTPDDLKAAHQRAIEQFEYVKEQHPKTAFAKRADWEMGRNFGVGFESRYAPPPPNRPSNRPTTVRPPVRIPEL
ncbi:MAG: hypothetical protein WD066_20410 [Planctomycetaceae bacterium]